jgi:hypothetical protein
MKYQLSFKDSVRKQGRIKVNLFYSQHDPSLYIPQMMIAARATSDRISLLIIDRGADVLIA